MDWELLIEQIQSNWTAIVATFGVAGGGGDGAHVINMTVTPSSAGRINTGGGGGGGFYSNASYNSIQANSGGSGIVIVRYRTG